MKGFPISVLTSACIIMGLFANSAKAQTVPCNTSTPVSYTLTETGPGEIYIPDASTRPWKGGDTLKIPAKTYNLIEISTFTGDPCKKIVIINSGGQVVVTNFRMRNNSRYFKVTGTGKPGVEYGFKINGGMMAVSLAHHFEIDHMEISGGSLGMFIKTTPDATKPITYYTPGSGSNYVMSDIYIHHNYVHDIAGEGMYIGHTGPSGNQEGTGLIPLRLDNVEVSYNVLRNIDWDGIQVSNARNASIHHNTVWNFGRINKGNQQSGIIMGGNTTVNIYNNTVSKGTGNGMQLFGYGTIRVYNNHIDSAGNDLTTSGQESFYADDYITTPESNPKQEVLFYNNVLRNPMPKGAVRVAGYNFNSLPTHITDNQYYIPNAASNWQFYHVVANTPGSIKTNNVLIGGTTPVPVPVPNVLPVVNAGADQVVTLPASSISLSGSATDADGSITAYTWTKISGPAAGAFAVNTNAVTTVSSLVQGTYVFELKATDNAGGVSRDSVKVTVNAEVVSVPTAGKKINVNINGGISFASSEWNNWNTNGSLTSASLKYNDATTSVISAVLNSQSMVVDNGATYASTATNPPGSVLRFNSASTSTRLLTIRGLDATKKYNLEFFGSRATTGNKTVIEYGSSKDTINTDNNIVDAAKLSSLSPANDGTITVTISRIGTWNYIAGFSIAEAGAVTVVPNQLPVVNAGADKSITLPVNTISLTGTASDPDGTIAEWNWRKISGPSTLLSAATSVYNLTALLAGTYTFELEVTDNAGAKAKDTVQVIVNPAIILQSVKQVKVNMHNGTSYNSTGWNNWNLSSLTSAVLNYTDGAASGITAVLNSQSMVVDNGATYAASSTVVPGAVLRFNSASTSTRLLTIKGLNPLKKYSFEFYGSRATTGNKTIFQAGNVTDTINTDNNTSDVASLMNLTPDNAGNIVITISRMGTWNYIAGFMLAESSDLMRNTTLQTISDSSVISAVQVQPTPFSNTLQVTINDKAAGNYTIELMDLSGKVLLQRSGIKHTEAKAETFDTRSFRIGNYQLKVVTSVVNETITVTKAIIAIEQ